MRLLIKGVALLALGAVLLGTISASAASFQGQGQARSSTTTPIKHLVVIFQENVSFDHYFGTYPNALNLPGEPFFHAKPGTPSVNGLTPALLTNNPNLVNPSRLSPAQALTCDQDHRYTDEQAAFDHGLMDQFVQKTGCAQQPDMVMNYYDGNTVTALWNYAQHFAMSDNSYGTTFGPSTPGALNLVSGQTHGAIPATLPGLVANDTVINDARPAFDDCAAQEGGNATNEISMSGPNVGDLLNAQGITWGWFQGGFTPSSVAGGVATCDTAHTNIGNASVLDYISHHEPFQYYQSTANPHHLPPSSLAMIGKTDQANHQYDLTNFWAAANVGHMPAVSFLKAPAFQDGHAGYSDPIDEQHFLVDTINRLQKLPTWSSTAVVISYDDSDGWYDHQIGPIVSQSNDPNNDALTDAGMCGTAKPGAFQDRCGYGPRLPLLVVSPFAKTNFVDHAVTDQSSILRFIEDNWRLGRIGNQSFDALAGTLNNMFDFSHDRDDSLLLNPTTGS